MSPVSPVFKLSSPVRIKVFAEAGARLPERASRGAAGYDVYARLDPDLAFIEISPGDRITVPTGLYFEIPEDHFITLRPRSGLALKQGLTLLNTPATIDSDYRGELRVLMINLGHEAVRIAHGDRIAQLLVERSLPLEWAQVESRDDFTTSERGAGGFGSTGRSGNSSGRSAGSSNGSALA